MPANPAAPELLRLDVSPEPPVGIRTGDPGTPVRKRLGTNVVECRKS